MPAAVHHQMPLDGVANQRQIPHDIKDLVTHELVFEAKRVEHACLAEHDGVFE